MTIDQAVDLADHLWTTFDVDATTIEEYSGRGMYGETTPAVVVPGLADVILLGVCFGDSGYAYRDIPRRIDQMGLGYVIY